MAESYRFSSFFISWLWLKKSLKILQRQDTLSQITYLLIKIFLTSFNVNKKWFIFIIRLIHSVYYHGHVHQIIFPDFIFQNDWLIWILRVNLPLYINNLQKHRSITSLSFHRPSKSAEDDQNLILYRSIFINEFFIKFLFFDNNNLSKGVKFQ